MLFRSDQVKNMNTSQGDGDTLISTWFDVSTNILRLLTSLTHDNELAANHIIDHRAQPSWTAELLHFLHRTITTQLNFHDIGMDKDLSEKMVHFYYDWTIFTLNIFTNLAESSRFHEVRSVFMNTVIDGSRCALLWLTDWAVTETHAFRDQTIESNEPATEVSPDHRLDRREGESLVTAGNAFILLTCMMRKTSKFREDADQARNIIFGRLPMDVRLTGQGQINFIIKTLTAFCNYYHYSIGDLSAAVIGPVKLLLSELEEMK